MFIINAYRPVRLFVILFSLALLSACSSSRAEQVDFSPQNPPLEVAAKFENEFSKQTVTGEVRNVSNRELKGVEVVVEFVSATDRVLDVAIQQLPPLAPNATAPFGVEHASQYTAVDADNARFRFRFNNRGKGQEQEIPYRDKSAN